MEIFKGTVQAVSRERFEATVRIEGTDEITNIPMVLPGFNIGARVDLVYKEELKDTAGLEDYKYIPAEWVPEGERSKPEPVIEDKPLDIAPAPSGDIKGPTEGALPPQKENVAGASNIKLSKLDKNSISSLAWAILTDARTISSQLQVKYPEDPLVADLVFKLNSLDHKLMNE